VVEPCNELFQAPYGYLRYQVVMGPEGKVMDLQILQANATFSSLFGREPGELANRSSRESLFSQLENPEVWLKKSSQTFFHGKKMEWEQFLPKLSRWFKVYAFSVEEGTALSLWVDITTMVEERNALRNNALFFQRFLDEEQRTLDFDFLCEELKQICGAKYVAFNLFEPDAKHFRTLGLAGLPEHIEKAASFLGFELRGKRWDPDQVREEKTAGRIITLFPRLHELSGQTLSPTLVKMMEMVFSVGQTAVIRIERDGEILGDFTAIMAGGKPLENPEMVEIFARQVGLLLSRRLAEMAQFESESKFRHLFDANPALLALSDLPFGVFQDVNRAFLDKLGFSREEVIGMTPHQLGILVDPEAVSLAENHLLRFGKLNGTELQVRTKEGEVLTGLFSGEKIDTVGEPCYLTLLTDITPLKKAERAARKASLAKSEFLAAMSHEIRTPLSGVIGFCELMMSSSLDGMQKRYMENIQVSAHALMELINDILDFSKIEAGKLELEIRRVNLHELLSHCMDVVKLGAREKGLELLLDIPPDVPETVMVDGTRLRQVLTNLLGNAVKFTDSGEISLSVSFDPTPRRGGMRRFSFFVQDTGIGISEEKRKMLFQAFSQGDPSIARSHGGTGLGLVISNQLLQMMRSSLQLESLQGAGSTFSFSLELDTPSQQPSFPRFPELFKAMVVDDSQKNRGIMEKLLRAMRIETVVAANASEGLRILSHEPDVRVLFLDLSLPGENARETLRKLSGESPFLESGGVLVLMGNPGDMIPRVSFPDTGVSPVFLEKPVHRENLLRTLQGLVYKGSETKAPQPGLASGEPLAEVSGTIQVVEDHPVNRMLIRELLVKTLPGVEVVESMDGEVALSHFQKYNPDLVFMDIQLPVKDGYQVCREIRQSEKGRGKHVPIIALTASAIQGEEKRCREAGMDGFLSKPLLQHPLAEVLTTFFPIRPPRPAPSRESLRGNPKRHFDPLTLSERMGFSGEEMVRLVTEVQEHLEKHKNKLALSVGKKDWQGFRKDVHSLKGLGLAMCFQELVGITLDIEKQQELPPPGKLDSFFLQITREIQELSVELQRFLETS